MKKKTSPKPNRKEVQPRLPHVDEDFLKQYLEMDLDQPGKPSFLTELIKRFLISAPERIQAVELAIDHQIAENLNYEAHALKNIAGNVGARYLTSLCDALETKGEQSDFLGIEAMIETLRQEYLVVAAELKLKFLS